MDTMSKEYRSQDARIKSLETNLRTIDERHVLGLDNLHGNYTSQNERVKSLERARETQSDVLSKTEGSLAKVEAKLIAAEERISKEVSNMRIDKQSQNLDASAGKSGSYQKIKTRCRKVEERLKTFEPTYDSGTKSISASRQQHEIYTRVKPRGEYLEKTVRQGILGGQASRGASANAGAAFISNGENDSRSAGSD